MSAMSGGLSKKREEKEKSLHSLQALSFDRQNVNQGGTKERKKSLKVGMKRRRKEKKEGFRTKFMYYTSYTVTGSFMYVSINGLQFSRQQL